MESRNILIKLLTLAVAGLCAFVAGKEFLEHRNYREPMVAGPGVTEVRLLSSYSPAVRDTINDCHVYILDSGKPGATVMVIGGTHPEEPAGVLAAAVLVQNAHLDQGKLVVVPRVNRSASTCTRPGEAYPTYFHVKTPWGVARYRMGDRCSNALDSWPDPEVYLHYPSRQMLAYMDIRNFNRTWPGRANGLITERTNYAFMEVVRQEKVDIFIDYHEAELEYPVENTIVTHERGQAVAAMTSMMLTAQEFPVPMGMEFSPKALHGLSHREVGDYSEAMSMIFEVAEPMLDRIRGITDEKLLMEGRDDFVVKAGEHKLLYAPMDDQGWPIDVRVGRHLSALLQTIDSYNMTAPDKPMMLSGVPRYAEVVEKGTGAFLQNPSAASADRVYYD